VLSEKKKAAAEEEEKEEDAIARKEIRGFSKMTALLLFLLFHPLFVTAG
jgi:hypothetical protein